MIRQLFDRLWHDTLGRPYRLVRTIDQGAGPPVVLLHGIGASGYSWRRVAKHLADKPYRVVALDLLGFGRSPKPERLQYSVDDHARAVIAAIERLRPRQPVILVGHSMGCLVAVRVARLRPGLVKHLVLYEMPLYIGLPETRRYRIRRDIYFKIYTRLIRSPMPPLVGSPRLRAVVSRLAGLEIGEDIWLPFVRSLEHTIMRQTTLGDIKHIKKPMDVIYGSLDMVVIRGKPHKFFGETAANITAHTIAQPHSISYRASSFLAKRIQAIADETV